MKNINIISKNTENVQPYSKNPRKNAEAESIKQFGFKVPIVIDSQNVIGLTWALKVKLGVMMIYWVMG